MFALLRLVCDTAALRKNRGSAHNAINAVNAFSGVSAINAVNAINALKEELGSGN